MQLTITPHGERALFADQEVYTGSADFLAGVALGFIKALELVDNLDEDDADELAAWRNVELTSTPGDKLRVAAEFITVFADPEWSATVTD